MLGCIAIHGLRGLELRDLNPAMGNQMEMNMEHLIKNEVRCGVAIRTR